MQQEGKQIGLTLVSTDYPSTTDEYWFVIKQEILINVYDFVSVENLFESKTIGIVQEIKALPSKKIESFFEVYSTNIVKHVRRDPI